MIGRAVQTVGILPEDRIAILKQAREEAIKSMSRTPAYRHLLATYCEVGIEMYRFTGNYDVYNDAMERLKMAESEVGDPEISKTIRRFERAMAGQATETEFDSAP